MESTSCPSWELVASQSRLSRFTADFRCPILIMLTGICQERKCGVDSAEGSVSTWKPVLGNGMVWNTIPMSAYSHGTGDGIQGFRAKRVHYHQTACLWSNWLYFIFSWAISMCPWTQGLSFFLLTESYGSKLEIFGDSSRQTQVSIIGRNHGRHLDLGWS